MITRYRADGSGDVIGCEPPPFNYQLRDSYARQLVSNAVAVVILAAITVIVGLSLVT
jgi:hypothetical protein